MHSRRPGEVDTAYFSFPPSKGDGHYVVYYHWSGYKDCIDVDVTSKKITNKYGVLTEGELYERIDHCAFEYAQRCFDTGEAVDSVARCKEMCSDFQVSNNFLIVR